MQVTHSDYLVKFLDPATPHGAQVRLGLIYKSACGGGGSTYYEKKKAQSSKDSSLQRVLFLCTHKVLSYITVCYISAVPSSLFCNTDSSSLLSISQLQVHTACICIRTYM